MTHSVLGSYDVYPGTEVSTGTSYMVQATLIQLLPFLVQHLNLPGTSLKRNKSDGQWHESLGIAVSLMNEVYAIGTFRAELS